MRNIPDMPASPSGGQSPKRRATRNEAERRIVEAGHMIAEGMSDAAIRHQMSERHGISQRSVIRYITESRKRARQAIRREMEELVSESCAFYYSVIQSPGATVTEKIHARKRLDRILGLESRRHEISARVETCEARDQASAIMRDPVAMEMAITLGKRIRGESIDYPFDSNESEAGQWD